MSTQDSLHSLLDYECLLFHCDWLGSDLRIGYFFSFRCPLANAPQLNTQLSYEWILVYEWMTYERTGWRLQYDCWMNSRINSLL
jgi:hypothetical protein